LARQANSTTVFLFWRIGQQVNSDILNHQRAEYGQKIVSTLATIGRRLWAQLRGP
jgi:hypothetical protein